MTTWGRTFDGDTSTVHVHLSVADQVKPSPAKEDIVGRRRVCWNGEVVARSDRASTDHGFDDLPRGTVVI